MKKRSAILRPVAWICALVLLLAMETISGLIFSLGAELTNWMSGLSTLAVIFLVMAIGSVYLGLVSYSIWIVPMLLVTACDWIYPSKHAFRYNFIGVFEILFCVIYVILGATDFIRGDVMFFFYANKVHVALSAVAMMFIGHQQAEERNKEELIV